MIRRLMSIAVALVALTVVAGAALAVPNLLQYQGRLTDASGNPLTGSYSVVFSIYNAATGGAALYSETDNVTANNGLFNVVIGGVTAIPSTVFDGANKFLGIKVGADAEMSPRWQVTSVGYALRAGTAEALTTPVQAAAGVSNVATSGFHTTNATGTAVDSIAITIPAAGYVIVSASGYFYTTHTNGTRDETWAIIREISAPSSGSIGIDPSVQILRVPVAVPTDLYMNNYTTRAMFQKAAAGTYKFFLNAISVSGTPGTFGYRNTEAVYVPALYGTVALPPGANAAGPAGPDASVAQPARDR